MHVEVYYCHPLQAVVGQRVLGCDRNTVEDAKAHATVRHGVMARWAQQADGVLHPSAKHCLNGCDCTSCSAQSCLPGISSHDCVGVEIATA